MLEDALVFGIKSGKVRRDAIAIGNDLTYQQKGRMLHNNRATSVEKNTQKAAVVPNMQRATFARKLDITRKFAARNCVKSTRWPKMK